MRSTPAIYIEWNEKDRDRVLPYNDSSSYPRLIGCYSHECPKKVRNERRKKEGKTFFEKWKNIHHELLLFVATHIHNISMSIGDKGHEMRIQISMPIYNSIV